MAAKRPLKSHVALFILLIAATAATVASAALSYRHSRAAAEDALRYQALGAAASLEALLHDSEGRPLSRTVFRDIIAEGRWEGIAFIALYDKNGVTLLHSNENLLGRQAEDSSVLRAAGADGPSYHYLTLGTEERVFVMDYPLAVGSADGVLRVAVHTFPVEEALRRTRYQVMSMGLVIGLLWIVGAFFIRAARRSEELKERMAEKERMAALGEMAAVLAHEIRNPLGSIKGFAQYLKEHEPPGAAPEVLPPGLPQAPSKTPEEQSPLDIIVSEAGRLEHLTEDLLLYARPVEVRPREFELRPLVDEVAQALATAGADNSAVTVHVQAPEGPGGIVLNTDRDKLKQVLLNVMQNAYDALERGGALELRSRDRGSAVVIEVQDSGCGMDAEARAKARAPFYTTKAQGTGLGLAIVDKLVKALGGGLAIESAPGAGTTVRITVPKNFI